MRIDGSPLPKAWLHIQHHERQPPLPFQRILPMEADDRFLLPRLHTFSPLS
jgi:hypothetical protein